jgi:seryl-tRNA synthetase
MTTQKDDLICEIKELQTEINEHVRKINQLKSVVSVKERQLQEFPITLQRIIEECMFVHKQQIQLDIVENILDRVEIEFLSKPHQEAGDTETYYKNKGWNNCLKELKVRLRE